MGAVRQVTSSQYLLKRKFKYEDYYYYDVRELLARQVERRKEAGEVRVI